MDDFHGEKILIENIVSSFGLQTTHGVLDSEL